MDSSLRDEVVSEVRQTITDEGTVTIRFGAEAANAEGVPERWKKGVVATDPTNPIQKIWSYKPPVP